MVIKCKMCSRENTIDIVEDSIGNFFFYNLSNHNFFFKFSLIFFSSIASYDDDTGKFKTIIQFDCRGIEPIDFDPREGFIVKANEDGPVFEDVEIENGDWVDFDEKNGNSVSIAEFKSQFIKIKGK